MNDFFTGLQRYLTEEQLLLLGSKRIGIAGVGGLGSNCACNLVRSGFCQFVLLDFDCVEISNLNRQFFFLPQLGLSKVAALKENLLAINPDLAITTYQERLTENNRTAFFGDCDVIVEGFDEPSAKKLLLEQYWSCDKLVVGVSGMAGFGDSDRIVVRKIKKNIYLIGDGVSGIEQRPPFSPCVSIAAAKQADVILTYFLEGEDAR